MKTIGQRVVALREALGLGPSEAARLIGITQPSMWNIEHDVTKSLQGATLAKMCEVFRSTAEHIMFGAGHPSDEALPMIEAELLRILRLAEPALRLSILKSARGLAQVDRDSRKDDPNDVSDLIGLGDLLDITGKKVAPRPSKPVHKKKDANPRRAR